MGTIEDMILPSSGDERYPVNAAIWRRDSTGEWVLEIDGTINDTYFNCRHTEPLTTAPEDVAGLPSQYDRGRRDMLNTLLALNPKAAQRLHVCRGGTEETFTNHDGRLPFDVVFWITEVAEQLGIKPKDDQ